jgi:hypothetical protein
MLAVPTERFKSSVHVPTELREDLLLEDEGPAGGVDCRGAPRHCTNLLLEPALNLLEQPAFFSTGINRRERLEAEVARVLSLATGGVNAVAERAMDLDRLEVHGLET